MRLLKLSALTAALLLIAFGLSVLSSLRDVPAHGQDGQGEETATRNGDVNCDGTLNISDPVYLIQYLFQRGPEPCALAEEPGLTDVVQQLEALKGTAAGILQQMEASSRSKWPPRPEDIVNLAVEQRPWDRVYPVPDDKFLVITDITFVAYSESPPSLELYELQGDQKTLKITLAERPAANGEGPTIKTVEYHSPVGLVFAPGSIVGATASRAFTLVGYLAARS